LLVFLDLFFAIFCPKIACQAPKPPNPLPDNNIRVTKKFTQTAIIEIVEKKTEKPGPKRSGLFTLSQINEDFTSSVTDFKDFRTDQKSKYKSKVPAMKTLHSLMGGGGASLPRRYNRESSQNMPDTKDDKADNRTALLNLIATLSFKLGDFTLASGKKSDYYIDCRTTTLHAEGGRLSGLVLYDLIREHIPQAEAVGGLTMGADPLVSNTASASAWALADHTEILELSRTLELGDEDPEPVPTLIHGFLVRKAEKTHGTGRKIEGFLTPGAHVVIVDDVCTTGGSTITAIEAAREAGMHVAGVLCLVDREQGGRANIEAACNGAPFIAVFTATEVRAAHLAQQKKRKKNERP
jgi:orotate phosphoribosyltransferase